MFKKIRLALVLLGSFLLSSCQAYSVGSDSLPSAPSASPKQDQVVLEFWHTYSDIEAHVFTTEVLPLFEKEHPNIVIHAVRQDYTTQLNDNIKAAVAENKQPDVMRMDIIWVPQFAKSGALADLSLLPDFAKMKEKFSDTLINTNLYKGQYYGIPLNTTTMVAIYNKTLLHQAGLTSPPTTFQQLIGAAQQLKKQDSHISGISICCSSPWGMLPYFWTFGGKLLDPEFTHATGYLDSPESIAAIQKIKKLYDEQIISYNLINGDIGGWDGLFGRKILMIDEAHWFYIVNSTDTNQKYLQDTEIGLFPSDLAPGTSIIGGENLVMFKNSAHPQETWTFMKWMASEKPQEIMAKTGLIPSIKDFQTDKLSPTFQMYVQQLQHAKPRPAVPEWSSIDPIFAKMMEKVLTNEEDIQGAVHRTAVTIDQLLTQ